MQGTIEDISKFGENAAVDPLSTVSISTFGYLRDDTIVLSNSDIMSNLLLEQFRRPYPL